MSQDSSENQIFSRMTIGLIASLLFALTGFFLTKSGYGSVCFIFVPFCAGVIGGIIAYPRMMPGTLLCFGLFIILACLVLTGFEGNYCVLMAFAIIILPLIFGSLIGWAVMTLCKDSILKKNSTKILLFISLLPLIMGANQAEVKYFQKNEIIQIQSQVYIPVPPERVWLKLTNFQNNNAKKTLPLKIGLPTLLKYKQEANEVGAKRFAVFEKGTIEGTIMSWEENRHLRMTVDRVDLPGRHWLTFVDEEYHLIPEGNGTLLKRRSTIMSNLNPRVYWRPLEKKAVQFVDQFIFSQLVNSFYSR